MSTESTLTSNAVVIPTRILSREWVSYLDDDNDEYYYNLITHETTWDYPLEASNIKIENNNNNSSNNNNITIITNTPPVNNNTSSIHNNEITNINGKSNTIITNNDNNRNNNDNIRMGIDQTIPSSTATATTLEVNNNTNISSNNVINNKLEVIRTKNLDDDGDNDDNDVNDKTELELPTPWIKYLTKDGYEYYYNPITKVTTWEFPTAAVTSSTATCNQSVVADSHDDDDISPHMLIVETNESLNISHKESFTIVDESNIESTTKSADSPSESSIVKESKDESKLEPLVGKEYKIESLVGKESKKEFPSNSKASAVSGFLKRLMPKKPPQKSTADISSISSSSSSSSSSIAVTATEAVDVIPTTTVVAINSGFDNNAAASTILSDDDCKIGDDNRVKETDHGTTEILQGIKAIDHESGELSAHNDDVALQLPSSLSSSSSSSLSSTKAVIEGSRINKDIISITSSSDIDAPPPLPWLQFKNDRGSSVSL